MDEVEIDATVNYLFLAQLPEAVKIAILEGSSRSSKTYSIEQFLLIDKLIQIPGYIVRCWRANSVTHTKTTIQDFKDVMAAFGAAKGISNYWEYAGKWKAQEKVYKFSNGSEFWFDGTMDEQKIQGVKQHCSWLNEVMEITQTAYNQIAMRTSDLIIMDFNPSFNHHWVFSTVFTRIETGEVAYKHSTYLDNPFLSDMQIAEIEKFNPEIPANVEAGTADQWTWDVYGLGKRGKVKGAIFTFWEVWDGYWPTSDQCQRFGYGLDFGFTLDPTSLVECALFQDVLYVREIVHSEGLLVTRNMTRPSEPSLENLMIEKNIEKEHKIYADCSAPGSIADLCLAGFNVVACEKGPDSIIQGINLLKQRKIRVHRHSLNIQLELEHYRWKERQEGVWDNKPIDKDNHSIDAIRYFARSELQRAADETRVSSRTGGTKIRVKTLLRRNR
jgi:phage terminase large subunit